MCASSVPWRGLSPSCDRACATCAWPTRRRSSVAGRCGSSIFGWKAQNADEFRRNFAAWPDIHLPVIHWTHTRKRVLTMERVAGRRVKDMVDALDDDARLDLVRHLADMVMKMFVDDGFFHADLHPGNIFFSEDGRIVLLDVGMVGRMNRGQADRFLAYWMAVGRRQRDRAFHHLLALARETRRADLPAYRAGLRADPGRVRRQHGHRAEPGADLPGRRPKRRAPRGDLPERDAPADEGARHDGGAVHLPGAGVPVQRGDPAHRGAAPRRACLPRGARRSPVDHAPRSARDRRVVPHRATPPRPGRRTGVSSRGVVGDRAGLGRRCRRLAERVP